MSRDTATLAGLTSSLAEQASAFSTIAIVAHGADAAGWETDAAWEIATAIGGEKRRVALVDLFLDDPQFESPGSQGDEDGIVDAFEYGVSLNRVAQPYEGRSIFFIPVGTPTADPQAILGNPRWERLAAGFAKEGAALVLYLPADAMPLLNLAPDYVIALDPNYQQGHVVVTAPEVPQAPLEEPNLGEQAPTKPEVARPLFAGPEHASSDGHSLRTWAIAAAAIVVSGIGAGAAYYFTIGRDSESSGDTPVATAAEPAPRVAGVADEIKPTVEPRPFASDLAFVLQTASYSLDQAARADRLADVAERSGTEVILAPTDLGPRGRWHRVLFGPFPDRGATAAARSELRASRTIREGNGLIIRAPFSLELHPSLANDVIAAGLDPFQVEGRLLVGAFEEPGQAAFAMQLLEQAGLPATLVQRVRTAR